MALYVETKAPGFRFGLGTISADGVVGQCVVLSGNNIFTVNDDPDVRSFGILAASALAGVLCAVHCMGGIYETDQYTGEIAAGGLLACDAGTGLLRAIGEGEFEVAEAISVVSGVLRFKLLV